MSKFKHCEDYINDKSQNRSLRKFLLYQRIPATWQVKWGEKKWPIPKLFATFHPTGRRVRVTMASRMGDVGITLDLEQDSGYSGRVPVSNLSDFSEVE